MLADLLVCPRCKKKLDVRADLDELLCVGCRVAYPVREGVPQMLPSEARRLKTDRSGSE